jgi:queuine tRNA-ribosyltransferase
MYPVIEKVAPYLPENQPRYLMGVGTPRDLREAVARGVDMFDCVLPTRLARHDTAITSEGNLNLKKAIFKFDFGPLQEGCECPACRNFSRAYIYHLCKSKEIAGARLLTLHNLHFYIQLMRDLRRDIIENGEPVTPGALSFSR